jgi:hypothetical protein
MNLARGGAATAIVLWIAMGCGGSEASSANGGDDAGVVIIPGPDGGVIVVPPAVTPPPVGGAPPDGIFVSASKGIAGADGSKTRPVKTLAEGLTLAASKHVPVIVCPETYTEQVTLADGVTMFGYFDCSNLDEWKRVTARATIASPTSPAIFAKDLVLPARLEGFVVTAPDIAGTPASGPAASSYGMIVTSSKNLSLAEISIRAGKG